MQNRTSHFSVAKSSPVTLVERFVEEVLNCCLSESISEVFSPTFRDHNPLQIFGLLEPQFRVWGTRDDVRFLVELLARPSVDIHFHLEDAFAVDDKIAYRLFGQGVIHLNSMGMAKPPESRIAQKQITAAAQARRLATGSARLMVRTEGWHDEGKVIGDKFDVNYSCVGIFRQMGHHLSERWGTASLQ